MESMGARVVLKLVFAHGPLTRWTLTGQGIVWSLMSGREERVPRVSQKIVVEFRYL